MKWIWLAIVLWLTALCLCPAGSALYWSPITDPGQTNVTRTTVPSRPGDRLRPRLDGQGKIDVYRAWSAGDYRSCALCGYWRYAVSNVAPDQISTQTWYTITWPGDFSTVLGQEHHLTTDRAAYEAAQEAARQAAKAATLKQAENAWIALGRELSGNTNLGAVTVNQMCAGIDQLPTTNNATTAGAIKELRGKVNAMTRAFRILAGVEALSSEGEMFTSDAVEH